MCGARCLIGRGEASKGARCLRGRDVNWGEMSGSQRCLWQKPELAEVGKSIKS